MAQVEQVLVLDTGGWKVSVGRAGGAGPAGRVTNASGRRRGERSPLVGGALDAAADQAGVALRRPLDRGYLTQQDVLKDVVLQALGPGGPLQCAGGSPADPKHHAAVVTEPPFALPSLMASLDELLFEDLGFRAALVGPAQLFAGLHAVSAARPGALASRARCALVLDAGFSFTHAVPVFDGHVVLEGVRRLDLGGKALTNLLAEMVSYRAVHMRDEFLIMDDMKHKVCYCSLDVDKDLAAAKPRKGPAVAKNPHFAEYVLPDGVKLTRGHLKEAREEGGAAPPEKRARLAQPPAPGAGADAAEEQSVPLTNERFMVPEALFRPSDIGLNQAGVAELIVQAVNACPPEMQGLLYSNVVLVGGSVQFPRFEERLRAELRPLVPAEYELGISTPPQPELCAWAGASSAVANGTFHRFAMTRQDYHETGGRLREYEAAMSRAGVEPPHGRVL